MNQIDRLSAKIARLGEQIARETPAADPDRFVKFERDNHQPDGTVRPPRKREPTLAEMPEALRQYVGECCTEAIRADEPKPKFKVGDAVQMISEYPVLRGKHGRCIVTRIDGERAYFTNQQGEKDWYVHWHLELLPSPKQEGEQ